MTGSADLAAVEARLKAVLDPYRDRLEDGPIYGRVFLRRPGAKAHDWFAGVVVAATHVSLFLLPVHTHPRLLDGISDALRKRKKGASTFNFSSVDEALFGELAELVKRSFEAYTSETEAGVR